MVRNYRALPPRDGSLQRPAPLYRTATKRRKVSVACQECRLKRIKCEGRRPICSNCAKRGVSCAYCDELCVSKDARETVVTIIHMLGRLPSSEVIQIINSTKNEPSADKILALIRDGLARQSDAPGCSNPTPGAKDDHRPEDLMAGNFIASTHETVSSPRLSPGIMHQHPGTSLSQGFHESPLNELGAVPCLQNWSCITDDVVLTHHLLALYFSLEYPRFAPISKKHFLQDFSDRRHRYCSPMLVNALLSLGCHLSERPNLHGDAFFAESQRLFSSATSHHFLPTIQALVIMSTREARCGRGIQSQHYAKLGMRLAIEMGLHIIASERNEDDRAVLLKTFWGAFTLHQTWSLITGTVPQCTRHIKLPPKPANVTDVETTFWTPYVGGSAHLLPFDQLSNVRSVYQCFGDLIELVHQSLYLLYCPEEALTATTLLQNYHQYLDWYDQLPESLRLGYISTPAVLFTHLYYHFAVLLLFRRFINLRVIGSEILPWQVCSQCADAIQNLVVSYAKLYTLRKTASFLPYIMFIAVTTYVAIAAARLRVDPSGSALSAPPIADHRAREALKQNIENFAEIAPHHPFAKQALYYLRRLAYRWGLDVPSDNGMLPMYGYDDPEQLGDSSSGRSTTTNGAGTITGEWYGNETSIEYDAREAESNMEALIPQLFWLQDQHLPLDVGTLEQTGFTLLY
ncbi:Nitrogen assimilation transcription factor nit-4 [Beauveria bassiana]|nr:Nitrogen assimilation transcription factor nit-4 [Beauveria bassiana]